MCCSAGMLLLQLSIPQLRSGSAIRNLNLELEAVAYDLKKWRCVTGTCCCSAMRSSVIMPDL